MTLDKERDMLVFAASMVETLGQMNLDSAQANAVLQNAMAYTNSKGTMPPTLVMPATLTILQKMGERPDPMVVSAVLQLAAKCVFDWGLVQQEYARQVPNQVQ